MEQNELFRNLCQYACEILSYEEYHSMGLEGFHEWVRRHIIPIPKLELVVGQTYHGICRNVRKAVWKENGTFEYMRREFGDTSSEEINHYEDDDGYDVFVPIKLI